MKRPEEDTTRRFFTRDIGRAGRSHQIVAQYVMAAKGMDQTDKKRVVRIAFGAKDCRKRLNARSV